MIISTISHFVINKEIGQEGNDFIFLPAQSLCLSVIFSLFCAYRVHDQTFFLIETHTIFFNIAISFSSQICFIILLLDLFQHF